MRYAFLGFIIIVLSSCVVQHPKYTMVENTFKLEIGMSKTEIDSVLGIAPQFIKKMDTTGVQIYSYKYRTRDIKRFPIIMRRDKGIPTEGNYTDLLVSYSPDSIAFNIETCTECTDNNEKKTKIDANTIINSITTIITVTLPALLVFLSIR